MLLSAGSDYYLAGLLTACLLTGKNETCNQPQSQLSLLSPWVGKSSIGLLAEVKEGIFTCVGLQVTV